MVVILLDKSLRFLEKQLISQSSFSRKLLVVSFMLTFKFGNLADSNLLRVIRTLVS